MAALWGFHLCPSCGQYHEFCDPDNFVILFAAVYEFICPVTGERAELREVADRETAVPTCPAEAVIMRRVQPGGN